MTSKMRNYDGPTFDHKRDWFLSLTIRDDDCLIWRGTYANGRPVVYDRGRQYSAHHVAFYFRDGWLPTGFKIRRSCGNPRCVEPSHLEIDGAMWRLARFTKQLAPRPDQDEGCVVWTGAVDHDGYGLFRHAGKVHRAHRWVWQQVKGPISDDTVVRHKCDNPACVNINHLTTGSQADNMRDMVERGRSRNGRGPETDPYSTDPASYPVPSDLEQD